jgi:hypothetical protein
MNDDPLAPLCWPESRHRSGRQSGTPGGVFIQASHAIAHASATKPVKEAMVFSQRRAMRRKRLI